MVKDRNPADLMCKAAIAVALIKTLDTVTKGRAAGLEAVEAVDQAMADFEEVLHELGYEVVVCPASNPIESFGNFQKAITELGVPGADKLGSLPTGDLPN